MAVFAITVSAVAIALSGCPSERYDAWATRFNVTHASQYERYASCATFNRNAKKVDSHNARGGWQASVDTSPFAALAVHQRPFTGRRETQHPYNPSKADVVYRAPRTSPLAVADHWLDGLVGDVKDQGQFGTCWAQAASGVIEALYYRQNSSLDLIRFSAQQLSDCTANGDGCNGGFSIDAIKYAQAAGGIAPTSAYPYVGCGDCPSGHVHGTIPLNISTVSAVVDEWSLLVAMQDHVVAVAIDASGQGFGLYSSGVYDGTFDGEPDCCSSAMCLDHEVLAVGLELSGWANATEGKAYYIVKNSWGVTWGLDGGYIAMEAGKNVCGIATDAVFAE